jgi:hypothetical protein
MRFLVVDSASRVLLEEQHPGQAEDERDEDREDPAGRPLQLAVSGGSSETKFSRLFSMKRGDRATP